MSLGLREGRRRRRQQARWTLIKFLLIVLVIGALGAFAYETGTRLAQHDVTSLRADVKSRDERIQELESQLQQQTSTAERERARSSEWEQRYTREVPSGASAELFTLMQQRLTDGVDPERIRAILEVIQVKRECEQPQVRRLAVTTPISKGSSASFDGGSVVVSAEGDSTRNSTGAPEAWFDPDQPVHLHLSRRGEEDTETSGVLPLKPSLVIADREYRLTVTPAKRGFIQVTMVRCRFP